VTELVNEQRGRPANPADQRSHRDGESRFGADGAEDGRQEHDRGEPAGTDGHRNQTPANIP